MVSKALRNSYNNYILFSNLNKANVSSKCYFQAGLPVMGKNTALFGTM